MIETDTVRLLRECDAGIKMGVISIDSVIDKVESRTFKQKLSDCKHDHEVLKHEINDLLDECKDDGKEPNFMAVSMSKMKTGMELMMDPTDKKIADLMTDGCNMGVKSLNKYLNQYKAASESAKNITKRLITIEANLTQDIQEYL